MLLEWQVSVLGRLRLKVAGRESPLYDLGARHLAAVASWTLRLGWSLATRRGGALGQRERNRGTEYMRTHRSQLYMLPMLPRRILLHHMYPFVSLHRGTDQQHATHPLAGRVKRLGQLVEQDEREQERLHTCSR